MNDFAFTIEKRGHVFILTVGKHCLAGLSWDEMLGSVARLALLRCCLRGLPPDEFDLEHPHVFTITVETVASCDWNIMHEDGRFSGQLTFDEMLGFVASYCLNETGLYGGFKTYQQWRGEHWFRQRRRPVALLT